MLSHTMDPILRDCGVPPVTSLTIVFLTIIFLVHELTGDFKAKDHAVRPVHTVEPSNWYRFLTSPLVHSNLLYLLLSILGLLCLGTRLERKLGTILFMYTQALAWIGTVFTFTTFGAILYFMSDYETWLDAKHTGFAPLLFCYAVVDSYIGRRDMFRIIAPWLLVPIIPMAFDRVSVLSVFAAGAFGLLLTRGGLGKMILPGRDYLLRAQDSGTGRLLSGMWSSFCPVWSETAASPFIQSAEGHMCSDIHPTYENMRLIPMSSKQTNNGALAPAEIGNIV